MKKQILALTTLACMSMHAMAQEAVDVTGFVIDKAGNPVSGAAVSVVGVPASMVSTDATGKFTISVLKDDKLQILTSTDAVKTVNVELGKKMTIVMDLSTEKVNYGFNLNQTFAESTGAAATVYSDKIDNRSSYTLGNSMYGNLAGLTTMQSTGVMWEQIPSMFIRGQKTLNGNNGILIVVDGLERDNAYNVLRYLTPEEVESVTVLKDAAAVALYGNKGINGVLNIVTKRGKYKSREINFSYDHGFTYQNRLPQMADAYTYANAMNEALANDGKSARYTQNELNAFKSGKYPYYYPNIDWWDEVYRERGKSDIATLTFRGGSSKMRYFTMLNLQNGRGFINNANSNDGFSTQEKYSKANLRSNLDIDLTSTTKLQVNIMGTLNEFSRPGLGSDDLIGKLYTTPAAAFPIRTESGLWGGNATWTGWANPVALTQARGYSKGHTLGLWADMTLRQDLSSITKGLGASFRMGYDKVASYWEDHTMEYKYGSTSVIGWENGEPSNFSDYEAGKDTEMAGGSKLDWQYRSFNFMANVDWNRQFGDHKIYSTLMYTYKYDNNVNINSTLYHCNWSWYTHYGLKDRYFLDFALVASASNLLETGKQWHLSPTVGLAWNLTNEDFLKDSSWLNFLKLRASFGIINTDNLLHAILDKEKGLLPKGKILTHLAVMQIPTYDKLLFFSDAAVIPRPTLQQRIEMIWYAIHTCRHFGIEQPRIALIHCTEKVSAKFPHSLDYVNIVELAEAGEFGNVIIDGPLDVKTSCEKTSGDIKGIVSPINGEADVLIFPNIESGNAFYKAVSLFSHADMAGLLQGPICPVVLPSRSDSGLSKYYSIAMACLTSCGSETANDNFATNQIVIVNNKYIDEVTRHQPRFHFDKNCRIRERSTPLGTKHPSHGRRTVFLFSYHRPV